MEKQNEKNIMRLAWVSLFLTVTCVIFSGISISQGQPASPGGEYLTWLSKPDAFYTAYYVGAVILTLLIVALFTQLYGYLSNINRTAALAGIVFIPVYGAINLVCYSLQITVVPSLAADALSIGGDVGFVSQLILNDSRSVLGFVYGLAYSVLAIPSIIYGLVFVKNAKKGSGIMLIIHGLLYVAGIAGFMLQNDVLSQGLNLGAIAFLICLVFLILDFRTRKPIVIKDN
jgi:hypothetical protein